MPDYTTDSTTKQPPARLTERWGWHCDDCGQSSTGLPTRDAALDEMERHTEKRPSHDPRILVNLR